MPPRPWEGVPESAEPSHRLAAAPSHLTTRPQRREALSELGREEASIAARSRKQGDPWQRTWCGGQKKAPQDVCVLTPEPMNVRLHDWL